MFLLSPLALTAWALPMVDEPVKSGVRAENDAAVVIGVEEYFKLPTVPYADRDAQGFHDLMLYTRGVPASRIQHLRGANRETMLQALENASERAGDGGTVWVYFAGHGAASPSTGARMLLGDDVRPELASFETRALSVDELEEVAGARGHRVITLLDTCFTGHDRAGGELLAGKRFAVPSYAASSAGNVQWVAASPNQFSGPIEDVRHGAFTYAVLGALRGWADGQISGAPDGRVTAEEAHVYVTERLRELGIQDQVPALVGDSDDLVLTQGTLEPPPASPAEPVQSPVATTPVPDPKPEPQPAPKRQTMSKDNPRYWTLGESRTIHGARGDRFGDCKYNYDLGFWKCPKASKKELRLASIRENFDIEAYVTTFPRYLNDGWQLEGWGKVENTVLDGEMVWVKGSHPDARDGIFEIAYYVPGDTYMFNCDPKRNETVETTDCIDAIEAFVGNHYKSRQGSSVPMLAQPEQ